MIRHGAEGLIPQYGFGAVEEGGKMLFRVMAGAIEQTIGLFGVVVKRLRPLPGGRVISACNSGVAQPHSNRAGTGEVNKVQRTTCSEQSQMVGIQPFLGYRAD